MVVFGKLTDDVGIVEMHKNQRFCTVKVLGKPSDPEKWLTINLDRVISIEEIRIEKGSRASVTFIFLYVYDHRLLERTEWAACGRAASADNHNRATKRPEFESSGEFIENRNTSNLQS